MIHRNEIKIVDNEFYTAWVIPEYRMISHVWHKHCKGDTWRNNITSAADAFEKHNCIRWLSDDRRFLGTLDPEDWKWGDIHFSARCQAAGWKYFAMVLPESGMAKISIRAVCNAFASHGVETEAFTDYAKAFSWIIRKQ